jgi:hypothetical protein
MNIVCTLLLWALLPSLGINASRYLIECTECQILLHTSETVLCPILWGINLLHIYAREVR